MTFWEFAGNNPVVTVLVAIVAACGVTTVVTTPLRYAFKAYRLRLRHKNIAAHGWPPPHLDADGSECDEG